NSQGISCPEDLLTLAMSLQSRKRFAQTTSAKHFVFHPPHLTKLLKGLQMIQFSSTTRINHSSRLKTSWLYCCIDLAMTETLQVSKELQIELAVAKGQLLW